MLSENSTKETRVEIDVLAGMLRSPDILSQAVSRLSEDYFRTDLTRWLFHLIADFYVKCNNKNKVITKNIIFYKIRHGNKKKESEHTLFVRKIFQRVDQLSDEEIDNLDYFIQEMIRIKTHCHQGALLESLQEKFALMDIHGFHSVLDSYSRNGTANGNFVVPPEHASSFLERYQNPISVPPEHSFKLRLKDDRTDIDEILGGILHPDHGLLMSIIGKTGVGKTQAMIHVGYRAALFGFNVLHFPLEGTKPYLEAQYDARITNFPARTIFNRQLTKEEFEVAKERQNKIKGKITIAKLQRDTYTCADLNNMCDEMEQKTGDRIHVTMVGPCYGLKPDRYSSKSDNQDRLGKVRIYENGKTWAEKGQKRLVVFEDQVKAASEGKQYYSIYDTEEASNVSRELDFMTGLPELPAEKLKNRVRWQWIKLREAASDGIVQIKLRKDFTRAKYICGW